MKKSLLLMLALSTLCFLSACGSGGGSTTPPPPSPATHFSVTAPAAATAGTAFSFSVTALDASNNTATSYSGTVQFTSTDSQAVLPANSTLASGSGMFSATLNTAGSETISATDTVTASITGTSSAITVTAASGFQPVGNMETPRAEHTASLLSTGGVLVAGGIDNNNGTVLASAELFDPSTAAFTLTGSLVTARAGHTAVALNTGKILVAGGVDPNANFLSSAELYDP